MTQEPQTDSLATRRGLLAGVGLAGLAGVITACGASGSSSAPAGSGAGTAAAAGQGSTAVASAAGDPSGAPTATALAATRDIPVGGGTIFTGPKGVITQPAADEFKAFSAICTHMGCIVSQVSNGTIDCPCHGSQFSITTGAVVGGPAPKPLSSEKIKVSDGSIFLE